MAFLKDVESEELRELVKSCFKEINTLKEQLNDENKDIKSNKVVKNVLIQSESNNTNLQAKINELTDKVHKQDTYLKEKELELQEMETRLKEKDLQIKEVESQNSGSSLNEMVLSKYENQIKALEDKIQTQKTTISELEEAANNSNDYLAEINRLKEEKSLLQSESSQTEVNQLKSIIEKQTVELKEIPILKNQLTMEVSSRDQKIKKYEEEIDLLNEKLGENEDVSSI